MKIQSLTEKQNFNGKLVIVDRLGKDANIELRKSILSQLGSSVPMLKHIIAPKPFDLFISRRSIDYININANKTYNGVLRGETSFRSLHKSTLNQIIEVAKASIQEYESFIQKHV